jgi:CrcB protein
MAGIVGFGGAAGALLRDAVAVSFAAAKGHIPWGTVGINLSGCLALGMLLGILALQFPRSRLARLLLGTGVIGAYTTFSTFMVETVELLRGRFDGAAAVYVSVTVIGGLAAAAVGLVLAATVVRAERWLSEA